MFGRAARAEYEASDSSRTLIAQSGYALGLLTAADQPSSDAAGEKRPGAGNIVIVEERRTCQGREIGLLDASTGSEGGISGKIGSGEHGLNPESATEAVAPALVVHLGFAARMRRCCDEQRRCD